MSDLPALTPPPPFTRGDLVTLKAGTPCPADWRPHLWQHFLGKQWAVKSHDEHTGDYLLSWSDGGRIFVTTAKAEALTHA